MTNISLLSKRDSFFFFSVCQDNSEMAINCQDDLNLSLSKDEVSRSRHWVLWTWEKISEKDFNIHLPICVSLIYFSRCLLKNHCDSAYALSLFE